MIAADALLEMGEAWSGQYGQSATAQSFIRHFLRPGEGVLSAAETHELYRRVLWQALGVRTEYAYAGLHSQLERAGLLVNPHGRIGRRVVNAGWSDIALEVMTLAKNDRGVVPWIWRMDNNKETA